MFPSNVTAFAVSSFISVSVWWKLKLNRFTPISGRYGAHTSPAAQNGYFDIVKALLESRAGPVGNFFKTLCLLTISKLLLHHFYLSPTKNPERLQKNNLTLLTV